MRNFEVQLKNPLQLTPDEEARVFDSLSQSGIVVIENFISRSQAAKMKDTSRTVCSGGFGVGDGVNIPPFVDEYQSEFRYPYICSPDAVEYVTSEALLRPIRKILGTDVLIHNALFQISQPRTKQLLDFHIDCGSIKSLNGVIKVPDKRLRTILYLSDVKSGGFSYIPGSAENALETFLAQPPGELFDPSKVPEDPSLRVTVHKPAGTLIIFDTHGLHRPECPSEPRHVLNTWFARRDFSASLPATLVNFSYVPKEHMNNLRIFDSEIKFDISKYVEKKEPVQGSRWLSKLFRKRKKSNYAYYE